MIEVKREATDEELLDAIALRCSECFGALATSAAMSLELGKNPKWNIVYSYGLVELLKEAKARNLDLSTLETAVPGTKLITETDKYKGCIEIIEEEK